MMPFNFKDSVPNFSELCVYGAGRVGSLCLEALKLLGLDARVRFFIDSDPQKWGTSFLGKEITSPEYMCDRSDLGVILGAASPGNEQIYENIKNTAQDDNILTLVPTDLSGCMKKFEGHRGGEEGIRRDEESLAVLYDLSDAYTAAFVKFFSRYKNIPGMIFLPFARWRSFEACSPFPEHYWGEVDSVVNGTGDITFVDAGAYTGDSLLSAAFIFGLRLRRIYAFEPVSRHYELLKRIVKNSAVRDKTVCLNSALGADDGEAKISYAGEGSQISASGSERITVKSLDIFNPNIQGSLFIKMDIEGYEMDALKGAAETIKTHRPEMAVCVYHKALDAWTLPSYLKTLVPEYKFILRGGNHTVCYASVNFK